MASTRESRRIAREVGDLLKKWFPNSFTSFVPSTNNSSTLSSTSTRLDLYFEAWNEVRKEKDLSFMLFNLSSEKEEIRVPYGECGQKSTIESDHNDRIDYLHA